MHLETGKQCKTRFFFYSIDFPPLLLPMQYSHDLEFASKAFSHEYTLTTDQHINYLLVAHAICMHTILRAPNVCQPNIYGHHYFRITLNTFVLYFSFLASCAGEYLYVCELMQLRLSISEMSKKESDRDKEQKKTALFVQAKDDF